MWMRAGEVGLERLPVVRAGAAVLHHGGGDVPTGHLLVGLWIGWFWAEPSGGRRESLSSFRNHQRRVSCQRGSRHWETVKVLHM